MFQSWSPPSAPPPTACWSTPPRKGANPSTDAPDLTSSNVLKNCRCTLTGEHIQVIKSFSLSVRNKKGTKPEVKQAKEHPWNEGPQFDPLSGTRPSMLTSKKIVLSLSTISLRQETCVKLKSNLSRFPFCKDCDQLIGNWPLVKRFHKSTLLKSFYDDTDTVSSERSSLRCSVPQLTF